MQLNWLVYLLECADSTYYCGCTNKPVEKRVEVHNTGKGSKYTRTRLPVRLVVCSQLMDKSSAYRLEYKTKRQPRHKKADFISSYLV